jgi:hypothetical protein
MFGHDYYHATLRKYIIMFGNIFNEIQVDRFDSSGNKIQTLNVPLEYSPKQKSIQRVTADPTLNRDIAATLPRLGFEMTSLTYAGARKLNSSTKIVRGVNTGGNDFGFVYTPVPYDMSFSLHVLVKNAEDGTQIIEQILPFFTPDYTVTIRALPELNINLDIPIELNSVTTDDSYEGDFDASRRILTWQLDFTVKGYLFGPINKQKFIIDTTIAQYSDLPETPGIEPISSTTFAGNSTDFSSNTIINDLPGAVVEPYVAP